MNDIRNCDLLIVGGGLAGGLIALAMAKLRPDVAILLVEGADAPGGNHIWSFFDGDVDADDRWLVDPLVAQRWAGHDVRMPHHNRTLAAGYNSITSDRFAAHLRDVLGNRLLTGLDATHLSPSRVTLADGSSISARCVIDARGGGDLSALDCGWQKFLGRELRLAQPHGLDRPVIMDATVDQAEGYRFVYLLPFGPDTIFIEDTYYSDTPGLDLATLERRVDAYAAMQGWQVGQIVRQETGVLPVVMAGDFDRFWPASDPVARVGVRAGLFHPTTGYSLPDAVDLAIRMTGFYDHDPAKLASICRAIARDLWRNRGYFRLLDTMLYRAAAPSTRWRIFDRFYRLPEPLIARFYRARLTAWDKARILCGRPPVPIRGAIRALMENRK